MTKFQGPLQVGTHGAPGTGVSYTTIDASGTASFAGPIHGSAAATFVGPVTIGLGSVIQAQRTTVLSQNSATNPATIVLPSGSDAIDFLIDVEIPFAAGALVTAQRVNIRTGVTANVIAEIGVSASGRYDALGATGTDHSLLRNITATIAAFVSTKALASAATLGQAMLTVKYVQN